MSQFYRVLLLIPEGLTFGMLTPDQQAGINSVFGQYVMPMPGTIAANGTVVCDAVTLSNFDPTHMAPLGITWPIIGMWDNTGVAVLPLDEAVFMAHLPEPDVGPKTIYEPHSWAGWPTVIGNAI